MRLPFLLAALFTLTACADAPSVRTFGGSDQIWYLTSLQGKPYRATATLTFPEKGRIAGQAPCNRYFAPLKTTYPAFQTGPVAATKRACADLAAERAFLSVLQGVTRAEVSETQLILSDDQGVLLTFTAGG